MKFSTTLAPHFGISLDKFKASGHWLQNIFDRYELSLRRSTTLFKLEDAEVVRRAILFKSFVDKIDFTKYKQSNIAVMDETAVYMGQRAQNTVDYRGASSIYVPATGYESARVTVVLAIRLDQSKVTPLIIAKGKENTIQRIDGIDGIESEKAWAIQTVVRKWLSSTLRIIASGSERALIVWESASTHRAQKMKMFLAQRRFDQIIIPSGMTGYLQSLDLVVNKPFKDFLRGK